MFDAEAASFVCDFIECLTCSNGAPFRLMDWQRDAVTEFYGQLIEAEGGGADPKKKQGQGIVFMLMQYETFGLTQQFKEEFGVVPVVWRNPFE